MASDVEDAKAVALPRRLIAFVVLLVLSVGLVAVPPPEKAAATAATRVGSSTDPALAAIDISKSMFDGDQAAFVALGRDDVFADALAATPLAGVRAPVLYTTGGADQELRAETLAEIERLLGDRDCASGPAVFILGGAAAVSDAAERAVTAAGYCTHRFAGASRVETSVAIATYVAERQGAAEQVLVARADEWADALTGGGHAAATGAPVLLTSHAALHPAVADYLQRHQPDEIVLLGGAAALSSQVEEAARQFAPVRRVAGAARDITAIEIAQQLWDESRTRGVTVVNGHDSRGWTYALSGAVLAAREDSPMLFAHSSGLSSGTRQFLDDTSYAFALVIGPAALVPDEILTEVGGNADASDRGTPPAEVATSATGDVLEADVSDAGDLPTDGDGNVEWAGGADLGGLAADDASDDASDDEGPTLAVLEATETAEENDAYWTSGRIAGVTPGAGTAARPQPEPDATWASLSDPAFKMYRWGYLPYRNLPTSVGRLYYRMPNGRDNVCSGTVVARNLVLTALHCVFTIGEQGGKPTGVRHTHFRFVPDMHGYWSNSRYGYWSGTAASHVYHYPQAFNNWNSFYALEYALIEIPPTSSGRYIGDVVGIQRVLLNTHRARLDQLSIGYPAEGVFAQRCSSSYCEPYFCYAPGGARHLGNGWYKLGMGCNANGGHSGGPIFGYHDGRWWLTSVNSHGSWQAHNDRSRYWIVNMWGPSLNEWYRKAWNDKAIR